MNNPPQRPYAALHAALFAYMAAMTALPVLAPFRFHLPEAAKIYIYSTTTDMVENVALFIPLGFMFRLAVSRSGLRAHAAALAVGGLFSAMLETLQILEVGRFASISDVLMNGCGALAGSLVFDALQRIASREETARVPSLVLPLMNVVYLLIPLLWLNGLSMGFDDHRLILLLLPGIFGAGVIHAVAVRRFDAAGNRTGVGPVAWTAAWFFIGAGPALVQRVLPVAGCIVLVAAWSAALSAFFRDHGARERRFEPVVLRRLMPVYSLYLLLSTAWPSTFEAADWAFLRHSHQLLVSLRLLSLAAGYTLFGFMIGRLRGRIDPPSRWALYPALAGAGICLLGSCAKWLWTGNPVSFLVPVGCTAAALYGGLVHRLFLRAVLPGRPSRGREPDEVF